MLNFFDTSFKICLKIINPIIYVGVNLKTAYKNRLKANAL